MAAAIHVIRLGSRHAISNVDDLREKLVHHIQNLQRCSPPCSRQHGESLWSCQQSDSSYEARHISRSTQASGPNTRRAARKPGATCSVKSAEPPIQPEMPSCCAQTYGYSECCGNTTPSQSRRCCARSKPPGVTQALRCSAADERKHSKEKQFDVATATELEPTWRRN